MPRKRDENETAFDAIEELIRRDLQRDGFSPPPKSAPGKMAVRVKAGRKGGLKAGQARTKNLSAKKRSEIAKRAASERWKNKQ